MFGSSSIGQFPDPSQSRQQARQPRRNTLGVAPPLSSIHSNLLLLPLRPSAFDFIPTYLPPTQAAFQQQLVGYNKLVESGGLARPHNDSSSPLPSHSSNQVRRFSYNPETSNTQHYNTKGNGNRQSSRSITGERLHMTRDVSVTMADRKHDIQKQLPSRSVHQPQVSNSTFQSNSVPSTPHQHPREFSMDSRDPSPIPAPNHSPRSAYSETTPTTHLSRPTRIACKYETSFIQARRRMPYSIGTEKLETVENVKEELSKDENQRLFHDMRHLYDSLLPSPTGEANRTKFVHKLERMLNHEWPGHKIEVHLFGSSGNMLCTDDSDVDICITTKWNGLNNVCKLADLLARNGMEKVVCVPAKVPIVKAWDPELNIACDMNVNNVLALENTRMLRTYVQIDERVRPLAIIIKHWTKRRIVNDAGFGATLSSYTWICMVINFLQTRSPPILPALHKRLDAILHTKDHETTFGDDIEKLQGFGHDNKENIAELLFHFFRFYAHEMDYDKHVVSVRNGTLLLKKEEKAWHHATNNMFCVEEPFSVVRNLANTADETSFRGLHMELRRAFDLIAQADLELCCEQFYFPKEEERVERVFERPAPQAMPVIVRTPSQASNRNARGNFGRSRGNRNGGSHRRVSVGAHENPNHTQVYTPAPQPYVPSEWLSAQSRMLSDLKAQENSLRNVLYQQSQHFAQQQAQSQHHASRAEAESSLERNRGMSFDNPPVTAPIRPDTYFWPMLQPATVFPVHNTNGYPANALPTPALQDMRHTHHRMPVTNAPGVVNGSGSALRSHSQPASRPVQVPVSALQAVPVTNFGNSHQVYYHPQNGMPITVLMQRPDYGESHEHKQFAASSTSPPNNHFPKEYIGYFVHPAQGQPTPSGYTAPQALSQPPRRESSAISHIPAYGESVSANRRPSTDQFPHGIFDRLRRSSRSPSSDRSVDGVQRDVSPLISAPYLAPPTESERSPLVVNGSSISAFHNQQTHHTMNGERTEHVENTSSLLSNNHRHHINHDTAAKRTDLSISANGTTSTQQVTSAANTHLTQPRHQGLGILDGESAEAPSRGPVESINKTIPDLRASLRPSHYDSVLSSRATPLPVVLDESPASHLSPVHELPSPSPLIERRLELEAEQIKADRSNNMNGKAVAMVNGSTSSRDKPSTAFVSDQARSDYETAPVETLKNIPPPRSVPPRTNGHKVAKSDSSISHEDSWQQKSKPKKKSAGISSKRGHTSATAVEKLPIRDSDRKGG